MYMRLLNMPFLAVGDDTVIGMWDSTFYIRNVLVKMRAHWEKEDHIFGRSSLKFPGKCCSYFGHVIKSALSNRYYCTRQDFNYGSTVLTSPLSKCSTCYLLK